MTDLITHARDGDRRALGRLVTAVEDGTQAGYSFLEQLYPAGGEAWTIGMTGAPGAGKSTIVDGLVGTLREDGRRVAVVAVDPSSPFTGGAILGDRVRMQQHSDDPGVYVRSTANRGSLGGIAESTPRIVAALMGLGFGEVVIETVGVGQSEVDVASAVDTTVVVVNPGWGDAVQAAKAGLLEVADVFVVNKIDRPGAEQTVKELRAMLDLAPADWVPPIVETQAVEGVGIDELWRAVADHRRHLATTTAFAESRRLQAAAALQSAVAARLRHLHHTDAAEDALIDRIAQRVLDPWTAARQLLDAG